MGLLSSSGEFYKSFTRDRNKYIADRIGEDPAQALLHVDNWSPEQLAAVQDYQQKYVDLAKQYQASLDPANQATYAKSMADHSADLARTNKYGSLAAKGLIGAIGAGAGLTEAGLLGGAAPAANVAAPAASAAGEAAATLPAWDTGVGGLFGSQAAVDGAMNSAGWFPGASMAGGVNTAGSLILGDLMPAGYQSVLGSSLLDKIISKAPELLQQAGGLMGGGGSSAGQGGGGGGMSTFLGYRPYQPPTTPVPTPFKAPTGLADFARTLQIRRQPKGLLGF